jgi:ferredoxin-NADP reductase
MNNVADILCDGVENETNLIKTFKLRLKSEFSSLYKNIQPGKHIVISHPDMSGSIRKRSYSITRKFDAESFEIAVKKLGNQGVSDCLHADIIEGSVISLGNVFGDISVESVIDSKSVGMVAGGIGITLPIALIRELHKRFINGFKVPRTKLIYSVSEISEIPFLNELMELSLTTSWFDFCIYTTRQTIYESDFFRLGRPSYEAISFFEDPEKILICGSYAFANDFRNYAAERFPDAEQLVESFTSPNAREFSGEDNYSEEDKKPVNLHIQNKSSLIKIFPDKSILESVEENGFSINNQCRAGICGCCRIKVSEGAYRSEPDFCLSEKEKENGYALACCTYPLQGDLKISI